MKGDALPYGYKEGDLVEVRNDAGEWVPSMLVGTHRRQLAARPLDEAFAIAQPWTYANPTRVRRMTPEALEAWLEDQ